MIHDKWRLCVGGGGGWRHSWLVSSHLFSSWVFFSKMFKITQPLLEGRPHPTRSDLQQLHYGTEGLLSHINSGFWMAQYKDEFPARVSGHLWALIWSIGHLRLKVRRCPMLPTHPIYIKNQHENNNILGLDTSELRFGNVQKLVLELETRAELSSLNHTINTIIPLKWS